MSAIPPLAVVGSSAAPRVRSLFAKFDRVNDPMISAFAESIPERFSDVLGHVASRKAAPASDFVMRNRALLKPFARRFHEQAGTLTAAVQDSLALLDDPTAQTVLSTHQPNLFSYGGIFKK